MNGAETAQMTRVQGLQQVERLGAAYLTDQDPIRPVTQRRPQKIRDGDGRQGCLMPDRRLCASRLQPDEIWLLQMNLCGLLYDDDPVVIGNQRGQGVQERRLAGARSPGDKNVLLRGDREAQMCRDVRRHGSDPYQVVKAVSLRELANREHRAGHGAWRKHRRDPRPILESRVEKRLHLGDLVTARAGDVLDGHGEIPRLECSAKHRLERAGSLHEHATPAVVHHHLGYVVDRRADPRSA